MIIFLTNHNALRFALQPYLFKQNYFTQRKEDAEVSDKSLLLQNLCVRLSLGYPLFAGLLGEEVFDAEHEVAWQRVIVCLTAVCGGEVYISVAGSVEHIVAFEGKLQASFHYALGNAGVPDELAAVHGSLRVTVTSGYACICRDFEIERQTHQ